MRVDQIRSDMDERDKRCVVRIVELFRRATSGTVADRMGVAFDLASREILDGQHDELYDPQSVVCAACDFCGVDFLDELLADRLIDAAEVIHLKVETMNTAETTIYRMVGWDGTTEEFDSASYALHRAAAYLAGWMQDSDGLRYFGQSHDDCVVVVVTEFGEETDAQCLIKRVLLPTVKFVWPE